MKQLKIVALCLGLLLSAAAFTASAQEGESALDESVALYNQGEYQKAADALEALVKTDEQNRRAWLYLGMSYAQLKNSKKAVKALLKADKIAASDPAESRPKIISKPRANYTDRARASMTQGEIKIAAEFAADGTIKSAFAFRTLPDGLTENTLEAAKRVRFMPAMKNGKPVSTIHILSYTFTIY